MRQFQGSLGPMQELEAERHQPAANPVLSEQADPSSIKRANLGLVTRYVAKPRMYMPRRTSYGPSFAQRLGTVAGLGILICFALAWWASVAA